jgi:hypothetical protein
LKDPLVDRSRFVETAPRLASSIVVLAASVSLAPAEPASRCLKEVGCWNELLIDVS